ncbi:protein LHY-like isoform X1 [Zingiber officinale]|uniref:protein LHY-like isoform X1 n=1 Tax=Zingiber officinale TaxID=94328 RepID=UPI001C4C63C9|nr:protein LHY-like isoform X1 [Zingiber officinale]XP_042446120.1 protein LHY-like isoform X1 [Zingiber officinale]
MEGNSSDEELSVIKKRKPYTITKQREKWTQEEHTRFLEALKLYGRAWQRIEEHIGTKTAVQIRSHAQKFFTKLEKEAVEKGIAPGQVHDIDIPPPRPKRKSSSPYPRKSSIGTLALEEAMSRKPEKSMPLLGENQVIDIKSDSSGEKLMAIQKLSRKRISEDANCSEVVNAFKDAKSNSISSLNKISSSHSAFIEFLPTTKEIMAEKIATNKSSAPLENSKSFIEEETEGRLRKFSQQQSNLGLEDEGKTSKLEGLTILDSSKGDQANANKSTMHVSNCRQSMQIDASDSQNPFSLTDQVGDEANGSLASTIPVQDASTISYFHQPHTASVPLTHLHDDQDVYRSFFNSSTFPSLIVSTLLQNPAVHAAANLAASFCPSTVLPSTQYIPEAHNAHMNPTPSLEAIAAATVSAAAAWWATQGLLPCFPPLAGFAFSPPNINVPCTGISLPVHVTADDNFPKEMQQIEDQHKSEAIKPQHASSKSMSSSSSGSDDCDGRDEISKELKDTGSSKIKTLAAHRSSDLDKAMNQKKVDRSSCGSNTASSSEVETYTMEKKHEKVNDEGKKDYDNFSKCGFNNYRLRSSGSLNESLKVSSEGRLAFQALFDREVLPQSFSPPQTEKATTLRKKETSESKVNHKNTVCCSTNLNQQGDKSKEEMYIVHEKRKVHQSGFKPYRRCSVEAESNALAEGAGSKRIRLQGEASS